MILLWLCVAKYKCFHNSIKPCSKHNNQTQFIVLTFCQSKEPWWLYCPTMCRRHITFEEVWLNSWWLPLCLASCWAPRWHNSIQHIYLHMTLVLIRIEMNRLEIHFFHSGLKFENIWVVVCSQYWLLHLVWVPAFILVCIILILSPDLYSLQTRPCLNAQILSV